MNVCSVLTVGPIEYRPIHFTFRFTLQKSNSSTVGTVFWNIDKK